jgi:hypothetical protein
MENYKTWTIQFLKLTTFAIFYDNIGKLFAELIMIFLVPNN